MEDKGIAALVGFKACCELGLALSKPEIEAILDYAARAFGEDRDYARKKLLEQGRPFELRKDGFRAECPNCHELKNYCLC